MHSEEEAAATTPEERSKQTPEADTSEEIARTTRRYLASRWQGIAIAMLPTVVAVYLVAWVCTLVLGGLSEGGAPREPWRHLAILGVCASGLALAALLARKLGALGQLAARRDHEAGVVVAPASRVSPWVGTAIGGLFGALIPSLFILTTSLAARSPVRFQPLEGALCVVVLSASARAISAWLSRDPQWFPFTDPRPFAGTLLFLAYGLAVAAGAPQPWRSFPSAASGLPSWFGIVVRVMLPAVIAVLVDVVGRHLYAHLQFRRLQRLVNESAPSEGDHGAD